MVNIVVGCCYYILILFSASGCPIAVRNKAKGLDPLTGITATGGDGHGGGMKGSSAASTLTSMGLKVVPL